MSFGSGIGLGGDKDLGDGNDSEWGYEWGSGWGYSHEWDLEVDTTGDVRTVTEIDELRKDVAFRTAVVLDNRRGEPLTPSSRADIRATIKQVFDTDPRLGRVVSLSVERGGDANTLVVEATVNTEEGPTELIYEV